VCCHSTCSTSTFSGKLINFLKPEAVFENNRTLQLDVAKVVVHREKEAAPSSVPGSMQPKRPKVAAVEYLPEEPTLLVTVDRVLVEGTPSLDGVDEGGKKSSSKQSRRYKSKPPPTGEAQKKKY
jgi:hypothetical protein